MTSTLERYQRIARFYDILDLPFEYGRYRRLRPLLFKNLSGSILDAGIGTGRNAPFYPPDADIVGIDLSPAMLARAARRCAHRPAQIELRRMDVTQLNFPPASFAAAVAAFLLCVLRADQQVQALRELRRVVRPGGIIRLLDYVPPQNPLRRLSAALWQPWAAWAYGADLNGVTALRVSEAGLEIQEAKFVHDDLIQLLTIRVPD